MNRTKMLARPLLVGIALLLYAFCPSSVNAEVNLSQSLDMVMAFHSQFKDPSFMGGNGGRLPSLTAFANGDGSSRDPQSYMRGLVAIEGNKTRKIAYDGLIGTSFSGSNSLNIDVSAVTVIAINMGKGGNSVAKSDIVLSPVQYLVVTTDAEVNEKLK
jgi:hypothetical protein